MTPATHGYRWLVLSVIAAILTALGGPGLVTVAQDAATPVATADQDAVEPLTTASVTPADAPLYLAATLDPQSAQWQLSEELIRRAGLGDLLDQAGEEVAAGGAPLGDEDALDVLLSGEAAFVITDLGVLAESGDFGTEPVGSTSASTAEDAAPVGFAAVFAPRDPDALEAAARDLTDEEAALRGVAVEEIAEGEATIVIVPGDAFEDGIAFVRLGDLLVASATPADLTPFVQVFAGDAPALGEEDMFLAVRNELPNDFLAYGFSNGPVFREELEALIAETAEASLGLTEEALVDQAFASLDAYTGFTVWADDPGFRVDTIVIPAEGTTLPPTPPNFDATLPERVPADTVLFVNSFDLGPTLGPQLDLMAALVARVSEEDPSFPITFPPAGTDEERAEMVFAFAGRFLAFNPRTDLIEQLVDEWGMAVSIRPEDPAFVSAVLVSGVADETRLNDAVTKLAVWFNLLVIGLLSDSADGEEILFGPGPVGAGTEEVDGVLTQVLEIPIPDVGTTIRLQWGVVDGELVFGVGDGFGEYTDGPDGSLADNPRYQAVMAELPDEHFSAFYLDLGQLIELAMPFIEEAMASETAFGAAATPEAVTLPDLSAIQAIAAVGFERDGMIGSSSLLYIAE